MARDVRTRQVGGGHTWFEWENHLLGMAQEVRVGYPRPVAQAEVIQPLNAQRPIEIVTSDAMGAGTITMVLKELYGYSTWQRLARLAKSQDLADIMRAIAEVDKEGGIQFKKAIKPPTNAPGAPLYTETFYNCVITDVGDDDPVTIATMSTNKEITVMYTHSLKSWINAGNFQFADRDVRTGRPIAT